MWMKKIKKEKEAATTDVEIGELRERLRRGELKEGDLLQLDRLLDLLGRLLTLIEQKNASIKWLKRMLFGPRSEKRSREGSSVGAEPAHGSNEAGSHEAERELGPESGEVVEDKEPESRRKGHGRRGAAAYVGARVVRCEGQLKPGDGCPGQCTGRLYDTLRPSIFIQFKGEPIVGATRYEQRVLRCTACQQRYTARLPDGVTPKKYDETVDVALVLAKYGGGMASSRISRQQELVGVPLDESVQYERAEAVAAAVEPIYEEMLTEAARGDLFYADDTGVKILGAVKRRGDGRKGEIGEKEEERKQRTTGVVAEVEGGRIALYFSGERHAGENVEKLLERRPAELGPPIQMGDALSSNWSGEAERLKAKCWVHARRKFVELEDENPEECSRVLDTIAELYRIEGESEAMSKDERLKHHQELSGPLLEDLAKWIEEQFSQHLTEPNSRLGKAMRYLQRHWQELTLFLRVAGVPLDNNAAERILKRFVLFRKNCYFYRTERGAKVGDMLMSLIETARLNRINVWEYLLAVTRNPAAVKKDPAAWLPWRWAERATTSAKLAA
jgi:transposase